MPSFSAQIIKVGINPCVDLPTNISRAFPLRGYIPVVGDINGETFSINLVPLGGGRHRLFLNGDIRLRAGVNVGSRIRVSLELDKSPPREPIPDLFAEILQRSAAATEVWQQLAPSRRKEILRYLNQAKREETLRRNAQKAVRLLLGEEESLAGIRLDRRR